MLSATLGSNKYIFCHWFDSTRNRSPDVLRSTDSPNCSQCLPKVCEFKLIRKRSENVTILKASHRNNLVCLATTPSYPSVIAESMVISEQVPTTMHTQGALSSAAPWGDQYHDLISHSVTLLWHRANQSLNAQLIRPSPLVTPSWVQILLKRINTSVLSYCQAKLNTMASTFLYFHHTVVL